MHFEIHNFTGAGWEQSGLINLLLQYWLYKYRCESPVVKLYFKNTKTFRDYSCDQILPEATSQT